MIDVTNYRNQYQHKETGDILMVYRVVTGVYRYIKDGESQRIPTKKLQAEYKYLGRIKRKREQLSLLKVA
jgi:hypothetical protein